MKLLLWQNPIDSCGQGNKSAQFIKHHIRLYPISLPMNRELPVKYNFWKYSPSFACTQIILQTPVSRRARPCHPSWCFRTLRSAVSGTPSALSILRHMTNKRTPPSESQLLCVAWVYVLSQEHPHQLLWFLKCCVRGSCVSVTSLQWIRSRHGIWWKGGKSLSLLGSKMVVGALMSIFKD